MREYLLLKHDKHLNLRRVLIYEKRMRGTVLSPLARFSVYYSVFSVYCSLFIVQCLLFSVYCSVFFVQWSVISGQYKLQCEDSI